MSHQSVDHSNSKLIDWTTRHLQTNFHASLRVFYLKKKKNKWQIHISLRKIKPISSTIRWWLKHLPSLRVLLFHCLDFFFNELSGVGKKKVSTVGSFFFPLLRSFKTWLSKQNNNFWFENLIKIKRSFFFNALDNVRTLFVWPPVRTDRRCRTALIDDALLHQFGPFFLSLSFLSVSTPLPSPDSTGVMGCL